MIRDNTAFHIKAFIIITLVYGVLSALDQYINTRPILGLFIFGYAASLYVLVRSFLKYK